MANIHVKKTNIEGLYVIEPIVFSDYRGIYFETYNYEVFSSYGLNYHFEQDIDLRKESKTYMSCFSICLSAQNYKQLYIPEGMGHGYLAMQDSRVLFKVTTHYIPDDEIGFAWNSAAINIDWGIQEPIQNSRDKNSKDLSEVWL